MLPQLDYRKKKRIEFQLPRLTLPVLVLVDGFGSMMGGPLGLKMNYRITEVIDSKYLHTVLRT